MSLISEGIDGVRIFALPAGIWADGNYVAIPLAALVKWRSSLSDMLYQVYVNGQYAGTTIDSDQREMIVQIPTSVESAVRIEVFAVNPEQAHLDFNDEISPSPADGGYVKLKLLRSQTLPIGATFNIYCDGGTGQIDYDEPINDSPLSVWPTSAGTRPRRWDSQREVSVTASSAWMQTPSSG